MVQGLAKDLMAEILDILRSLEYRILDPHWSGENFGE